MNDGDIQVSDMNDGDIQVRDMNDGDIQVSDMNDGDIQVSDMNDGDIQVKDMLKDHVIQVTNIPVSDNQVPSLSHNNSQTTDTTTPADNTKAPSLSHNNSQPASPFLGPSNLLTLEHTSPVKDLAWHPKSLLSPSLTQRRLRLRERQRLLFLARHHPPAQQGPLADPRRQTQGTRAARALQPRRAAAALRRHADRGEGLQPRQTDPRQQAENGRQVGLLHGRPSLRRQCRRRLLRLQTLLVRSRPFFHAL